MKKLFTLLVGALFAGNAFGQELVINGNCEGEMPADHYMYWVQDTRIDGVEEEPTADGVYQHAITHSSGEKGWLGHADIVENPFGTGHCVKVHVASQAESEAMGTARMDGNTYVAWNTQFFIYTTEPMPEGKWIKMELKVRGSVDGSISSTQAHQTPGNYSHYELCGSVEYEKKKWTKVWKKFQVSSNHVTGSGHTFFQAICFNLSTSAAESFDLYFDDISVEMSDEEPQEPEIEDTSDFINFMRKGIDSYDSIYDVTRADNKKAFECRNFMIQVPNEEGVMTLSPAPIVTLEDGTRAVKVPTYDFYTTTEEVDDLDSDGNQQFDPETGEVLKKTVTHYFWSNGTEIGESAPARWSAQFFVSTLHTMKSGERFRFKFKAKADKPANIGNQGHYGPSQYLGWEPLGGSSNVALTTEWQEFKFGDYEDAIDKSKNSGKVPSALNGCHTITFDCYDLQEANNYYFIFEECSFTDQNVTIPDRTLGEESINLIVNEDDNEKANIIDATPMLAAFDEADFSFLENEKDGVKLLALTENDPDNPDPDFSPEETFSAVFPWTAGGFIGANGYSIGDSMDGIMIRFDDESIDGKNISINVWNNPDAGITFTEGMAVPTQFCVSQSGWYYIYKVSLMNAATAAGIQGVKAVKADKSLIYNLAGQRVDSSYKGIVIKNGQKAIQK